MSSQNEQRKKTIYQNFLKIPIIGPFLEIASDYASEGSADYFEKKVPIKFWIKTLGWPILISALLATIPYPCGCTYKSFNIEAKAYDVALSLIPSLLGFGIGAYALVFGLSGDLLKKIQNEHNRKEAQSNSPKGSVLSINSAFAFPLVTMAITIVLASFQKILPDIQLLSSVTWFLTFLCLTLTYQLIVALYRLGRVIILDKF
ncbi:hypothetical protein [Delftia acidovorans]